MISNFSRYYVGTKDVTPYTGGYGAWRGNQKIESEPLGLVAGKIVQYDFSTAENLTTEDLSSLSEYYKSQGVIVEISGKASTGVFSAEWQAELRRQSQEMDENQVTINIAPEDITQLSKNKRVSGTEPGYRDDGEDILNHSFCSKYFRLSEEFDKYAIGYAKYLNSSVESPYNDVIFYGFENEDYYRKSLAEDLKGFAEQILSYFSSQPFNSEEDEAQALIKELSEQLADSTVEYAKRVAQGDSDLKNLTTTLNIYGTQTTYYELMSAQSMLQQLNEAGIPSDWTPGLFTEKFAAGEVNREPYTLLGNTRDCVFYANLGLNKATMTAYCDRNLSAPFAELVKNSYYRKEENLMNYYAERLKMDRPDRPEGYLDWITSYRREANKLFGTLDISDAETAVDNFENAMSQLEKLRESYYNEEYFSKDVSMYLHHYKKEYAVDALRNTFQDWLRSL